LLVLGGVDMICLSKSKPPATKLIGRKSCEGLGLGRGVSVRSQEVGTGRVTPNMHARLSKASASAQATCESLECINLCLLPWLRKPPPTEILPEPCPRSP